MLKLPIPLICIDVANPSRAIDSMRQTLNLIEPAGAVILTDAMRHRDIGAKAISNGIKAVQHRQSDEMIRFPGTQRGFFKDYEMALMSEPVKHVGSCSHVLFMEWDAGVLNPLAWDNGWLQYDYIGAPWPPHNDIGWPACDGTTNAVGNSGFSLQSAAFMKAVGEALRVFKDDQRKYSCDRWMCRTIRPWLEKEHGIKFAPVDIAARFACENRIYSGSFGFHGCSTVKLNNWMAWMAQLHASRH